MADPSRPKITCPACKRQYAWKPELAGRKVLCKCGEKIVVPVEAVERVAVEEDSLMPDLFPAQPEPAAVRCPFCQAAVSASAVICISCGRELKTGAPVAAVNIPGKPKVKARAPLGGGKLAGIADMLAGGSPHDRHAGRPLDDADEAGLRSRNILILGMVMLVGFVLPMCVMTMPGGLTLAVPNLWPGNFQGFPWVVIFLIVYPAIAGAAIIGVSRLVPVPWRGVAMIVMGLLPWLVVIFSNISLQQITAGAMGAMQSPLGASAILGLVGRFAMMAGTRSRWYRPGATMAFWFGAAGAVAYLLSQVIPIDMGPFVGKIFLIAEPFRLISMDFFTGFAFIAALGCDLGAAAICLMIPPGHERTTASNLAGIAFKLVVAEMVILASAIVLLYLRGISQFGSFEIWLMMFSGMIKFGMMYGPMMILIPLGATDILIGPANMPEGGEKGARPCTACGYDLQGSDPRLACPECGAPPRLAPRLAPRMG